MKVKKAKPKRAKRWTSGPVWVFPLNNGKYLLDGSGAPCVFYGDYLDSCIKARLSITPLRPRARKGKR